MKLKNAFVYCISVLGLVTMGGCASNKTYNLPADREFQGYTIIDAVDKDTVFVKVNSKENEKIAVAVRDIATTAYSYLEPKYMNSMATYEGKTKCCASYSNQGLVGGAGLVVYKFSFIGKGETTISLVARHKGLSVTPSEFETDHVTTLQVNVK